MFEYAALVDAPVQRFTGIVTGTDPDAEPLAFSAVTTQAPVNMAGSADAPVAVAAAATAVPRAPSIEDTPRVDPPPVRHPRPDAPTAPRLPASRPSAAPGPSLMPALLAVAAAGLTAMWWLRRETHDRR